VFYFPQIARMFADIISYSLRSYYLIPADLPAGRQVCGKLFTLSVSDASTIASFYSAGGSL
jgi:hypothetical protein